MEKTDNEVFAEFMGVEYDSSYHDGDRYIGEAVAKDGDNDWYIPHYSDSLDWLRPVVEKIMDLELSEFNYNATHMLELRQWKERISQYSIVTPIRIIYSECVKFIKWYNEVKPLTK